MTVLAHTAVRAGRFARFIHAVSCLQAALVLMNVVGCGDATPGTNPTNRPANAASPPGTSGSGTFRPGIPPPETADGTRDIVTPTDFIARQRAERIQLDNQVWADEVLAQKHEAFFTQLWDRLRSSDDPWTELANVSFEQLVYRPPTSGVEPLAIGVMRLKVNAEKQMATPAIWKAFLRQMQARNYQLVETEWHHSTFRHDGEQCSSQVSFLMHLDRPLEQPSVSQRLAVRGVLDIVWGKSERPGELPNLHRVEVSELEVLMRTGAPMFRPVLRAERNDEQYASAHPIIVYDLEADGLPEILIPRWNRVYRNQGGGRFHTEPLFRQFEPLPECGLVADVNQDDAVDFVSFNKSGNLIVYEGSSGGQFNGKPRVAASIVATDTLAMTAGDLDGDGDLDLWTTQYRPSYREGQMPTPYYDANDGPPAYLLINDGSGMFVDATEAAGLANRRNRRTYSTSFFDADGDRDLDLVVVSDYAGVDLYQNDGHGSFRDVSQSQLGERHLFGMAHTLSDFDRDGRIDIYAIGMSSTTARRLDRLGLGRADRPDIHRMRSAMGYGNRMYLRRQDNYTTGEFAATVARTGWSWGTTSFDFDRDGDRDIYVANGFRSGQSCEDYCTTFWRHDLYTGSSQPDEQMQAFFAESLRDLDLGEISWNGFEHNVLLMNLGNAKFTNIGFLAGVSFEYDSRAVVSADLDADGQPDLLVAEYPFTGRGFELSLNVYQNTLSTDTHWIGVDLHRHPPKLQPIGARVTVVSASGTQVQHVIVGDSFLSQHPAAVHFGLGADTEVESVRIDWPNAEPQIILQPKIDTWIGVN